MTDPTDVLVDLLERQGPRLHRLLARLTLREDVAEDLLQELFLKLRRSAPFASARDPSAYTFRAAVHLAFDWRRKQRRAPRPEALPEDLAAAGPSSLDGLVRREELEELLAALADLPELGRDCLVLHYLERQPYESVAAHVGKTPHQARALCHKAVTRLRRLLGGRKEVSHDGA